jgi:general secretion pathway protein I
MNIFKSSKQKAFTLIEVMAAVAVFTISSVGLYTVNQQNVLLAGRLENKTFAHWVALNTFNRLDIKASPPSAGTSTDTEKMVGTEWKISTQIETTPFEGVKKVTIQVKGQNDQMFANLVGFTGSRLPVSNGLAQ